MRFCVECNCLLYPRENRDERKLEYFCRLCNYVDKNISDSLIYQNNLETDRETKLVNVLSDMNRDPTLTRSLDENCAKCNHHEAVYFQADMNAKSTKLQLIFVCCKCGYKWQK